MSAPAATLDLNVRTRLRDLIQERSVLKRDERLRDRRKKSKKRAEKNRGPKRKKRRAAQSVAIDPDTPYWMQGLMPTVEIVEIESTVIWSGKYQGRPVVDLTMPELNALWSSWNGLRENDIRHEFSRRLKPYVEMRRKVEKSQRKLKKRVNRRRQNDVGAVDREYRQIFGEECPFEPGTFSM